MAVRPVRVAHVIENKAEAAYRPGDQFEKRRKLMNAWALYCANSKAGKIVVFRTVNARLPTQTVPSIRQAQESRTCRGQSTIIIQLAAP
jgi:hypothetical protein